MGMTRSFSYAPEAVLRDGNPRPGAEQREEGLRPAANRWHDEVRDSYLRGYLAAVGSARFIPSAPEDLNLMLTYYELERVIYEVGYELNNRTEWVDIPLAGLREITARLAPHPRPEST
jgi:maltose alpha-D-glucosyltransferase/alpha-amylase